MGLLGGFRISIGNLVSRGGKTVTTEYPKEKAPKPERMP